jgi:hypothetical protein
VLYLLFVHFVIYVKFVLYVDIIYRVWALSNKILKSWGTYCWCNDFMGWHIYYSNNKTKLKHKPLHVILCTSLNLVLLSYWISYIFMLFRKRIVFESSKYNRFSADIYLCYLENLLCLNHINIIYLVLISSWNSCIFMLLRKCLVFSLNRINKY